MTDFLAFITWNVNPEIGINLGPFSPRWYGVCFAAGFLIGYQLMTRMFVRERKPTADMEPLTLYMIAGTVIGMRLGHCFFYEPLYYLSNPLEILNLRSGGYASHGAVIGISIALWLYSKKRPAQPFLWVIDRIAIVTALAGALIRLGNLFNSEMIGKPTDVAWAFIFPLKDMLPRHPTQIYEALAYIITFILMRLLYLRFAANPPRGFLLGVFFICMFSARFCLEFFKENQVLFENTLPLNMGQLLSIPLVALGVFLVIKSRSIIPIPASTKK